MTDAEQREAARQFINKWLSGGDEKQDCHPYWIQLLQNVLGVEDVTEYIQFEKPVKLPEGDGKVHTRYIDGYIPKVKALIEQKGSVHKLDEKEPQSGGEFLTPYEQAKRYNDNLPYDEKARWIVTSNFQNIWIYDMNASVPEPTKIELQDLQTKYSLLDFLVKKDVKKISHEMEISIKAGTIVGKLYDALIKQYKDPQNEHSLKSLNALCVRLVFCLYAEDAGIFGEKAMFHDYLQSFKTERMRIALIDLFRVLDQKPEERDPYLEPELAAFPYVNGGLFRDENIEIPMFTDEIRELLLVEASENFDWSDISPTIFGAVFESTLNPETRRSGGMHYTSIENIHKVIDPLFLDDLKKELADIEQMTVVKTRKQHLEAFQKKLASLEFLDPAAGSGNFLTETYLSLRRLENQAIRDQQGGQMVIGDVVNPIQVSISQFHGIEINDFAVTVAKTALWIAESQMMKETESILYGRHLEFLPLKTNANIVESNALRIDWNDVISAEKLNYIMGNPPFVGSARLSDQQKEDRAVVFDNGVNAGELDYVACWYKKAAQYMKHTAICCAFVSTNSICQGQQVLPLWKNLFDAGIKIYYAYRTFVWDSEARDKAHVYCIIVGFSYLEKSKKTIYDSNEHINAQNINAYLLDAPNIFIEKRRLPLCNIPAVIKGFQPTDNGNLILEDDEKEELLNKEPDAKQWIRPFITAREYIHGKTRWCLWLKGISPAELRQFPLIRERVKKCQEWRNSQKKTGDAFKLKDTPYLMRQSTKFREESFIVIPRHSGERRRYVPFGFMEKGSIPGDSISIAAGAGIYHFGVLESNVHMAWMRVVCGRLKGDYRYSSDIVYNNFPWPSPTDSQKKKIEQTAQGILDARKMYPDSSLADMYDPLTMPPELRKAHTLNDIAVMHAYGFSTKMTETDCVAELMKMYQ
ncbi:MAG: methylase, partial [Lachnospiraceae bacterium]|nr:methylase [Lachnospiraceae bacterium]